MLVCMCIPMIKRINISLLPILFLLLLLLNGCAIPLPLEILSLVGNSVSYITTKKSLSDHIISQIADRDCAIWYIVKDMNICLDNYNNNNNGGGYDPTRYEHNFPTRYEHNFPTQHKHNFPTRYGHNFPTRYGHNFPTHYNLSELIIRDIKR